MSLRCELILQQEVVYDNTNVSGIVKYSVNKILKISHMTLSVEGVGICKWTEWRKYGQVMCPHFHSGTERYITGHSRLVEPNQGENIAVIQPGEYEFPFSVLIPRGAAPSFEFKGAHARYRVEVTISRPWKSDLKFGRNFTVISNIDLNSTPELRKPVIKKETAKLYNFLVKCGDMHVEVRTQAGGYVPGQIISAFCTILNESQVKVKHLVFALIRDITYMSDSKKLHPQPTTTMESVKVVPYQSGKEYAAQAEIKIPTDAMITMLNSKIIKLVYSFKVTAQITGIHLNPVVTLPIVIGTIPIRDCPTEPTSGFQGVTSEDHRKNELVNLMD